MTATQTESRPAGRVATGGVHRLLIVWSPEDSDIGYSRTLTREPVRLGREPELPRSLQLADAQVSRVHAVLEPSSDGYRIRDLGSRNGTFVNGRRVQSAELCDGDVVRVGSTLMLLQFLDLAACEVVLKRGAPMAEIIGSGHAIERVRAAIRAVRPGAPSLILGETGVGKELVAKAIHEHSGRPGRFVPVNCSALPAHLVESELFGHVRGAFTGADARSGLFAHAECGTLFLDEIGEIRPDIQVKLLRALALGEVRPVGSDRARVVDVAVVAATNVDLEGAVQSGAFRADLYARLMAQIIVVPPLRARREDILELTRHFLRETPNVRITPDAAETLLIYDWPYNVRELEQLCHPLSGIAAQRGEIGIGDLPERLRQNVDTKLEPMAPSELLPVSLLGIRRNVAPTADELCAVIEAYRGNVAQVAAFFDKDRRQIYRWAAGLDIDIQGLRRRFETSEGDEPSVGA